MSMQRKILIMGLPGAGKTALASALAPLLNAVVFNADAVRANLSRDLGFSHEDRVGTPAAWAGCAIGWLRPAAQ
jgi:adenylylsulfate kinase-like enzyme